MKRLIWETIYILAIIAIFGLLGTYVAHHQSVESWTHWDKLFTL